MKKSALALAVTFLLPVMSRADEMCGILITAFNGAVASRFETDMFRLQNATPQQSDTIRMEYDTFILEKSGQLQTGLMEHNCNEGVPNVPQLPPTVVTPPDSAPPTDDGGSGGGDDGGSMPDDPGTPPNDGGTPPGDGGTPPGDSGTPPTTPPDGGGVTPGDGDDDDDGGVVTPPSHGGNCNPKPKCKPHGRHGHNCEGKKGRGHNGGSNGRGHNYSGGSSCKKR